METESPTRQVTALSPWPHARSHINWPRDMFVSDQPSVIRSLTATGRTNPGFGLLAVLQGSARSAEPICDCEIPARQIPIITTPSAISPEWTSSPPGISGRSRQSVGVRQHRRIVDHVSRPVHNASMSADTVEPRPTTRVRPPDTRPECLMSVFVDTSIFLRSAYGPPIANRRQVSLPSPRHQPSLRSHARPPHASSR